MTELERVLLAKLEQIEQRHEQQTEDLRQQLQQQAHSLSLPRVAWRPLQRD
ncbi:hypothetical protein [Aeromonas salmonicida]|uniref:hypothetical protein n=1 Tax=Aeromonas salmonicida TaxID=645 RepID=UPI001D0D9752|nr:hypothetical protein [Aeromonas salmonicida]UDQ60741.1 hypothetical protein LJF99_24185 [Aeromonas salmonicida subsp. salmonicida]